MEYRREIDGLRSVAVFPVILFHAGFQLFGGGFVGVDVFFVISGYLITSIIITEKKKGTFSTINFYERRARRILPALFVVMLASLIPAWFLLTPKEMEDFSKSLITVPLFASNILFWQESGYFELANELKPLLHTWSLAVEEQFYLLYPLFLTLVWRLGKYWLFGFLFVILVISLGSAEWGLIHDPVGAFYLLPTRGWELIVGSLAAVYTLYKQSPPSQTVLRDLTGELFGIVGLLLISYAIFTFDETVSFPGFNAAFPTVGAALILLFTSQRTWVGKLLGSRVLVGLGLISYSTYLWHQPLFVFARYYFRSKPSNNTIFILILSSVILAYLSYRYVETPFRKKDLINRNKIFSYSILGSMFFVVLGVIIMNTQGFSSRKPQNIQWASLGDKIDVVGRVCDMQPVDDHENIRLGFFGDLSADRTVGLYGDSHASALSYQLDDEFKKRGIKGVYLGLVGKCQTNPLSSDKGIKKDTINCQKSFNSLLDYVANNIDSIIVVSRWTFRLYPVAGAIESLAFDNEEGGRESEDYREYSVLRTDGTFSSSGIDKKKSLTHMLESFLSTNARVILVYPIPELGWHVYSENLRYYVRKGEYLPELTTAYSLYKQRNKYVINVFDEIKSRENLIRIKPDEIFCNTYRKNRCVGQIEGVPLYFDDDHVSEAGAQMIVDRIVPTLVY
ncbi:putative acyltransferase [Desulfocapsa sulfexigens DSM 10523]|uniref:Putative acyltransferase n=1 Tax=Desulfocapsa sulfexigens (strain DSM 10523 / SB164P1) TaxID=1167006 RepID=M1PRI1_DESSD|nr:acyltransferase family protein [Desulfocapsa sulfexigens]AGF78961.1 putative acyltransferase [Desulfocapsa sulfexigens DSM 10523]